MSNPVTKESRAAFIKKLKNRQLILLVLFFFVAIFPAIVALLFGGLGSWHHCLAALLGFIGLSLMLLSFIPVTRSKIVTESFNLDRVYKFHHQYSTVGFWMVVVHMVLLWLESGVTFLQIMPLYKLSGFICLIAAADLVFFGYFRKEMNMNYDHWKVGHSIVSAILLVFGLIHIFNLDNPYPFGMVLKVYYVCLAVFCAASVFWLRIWVGSKEALNPFAVTEISDRGNKIYEMKLSAVGRGHQFSFRSGQVAWLTVERGPFAYRKHPFSIASSDLDHDNLSFAIRELGDFTSTIKNISVGTKAYVEGPFGCFNSDELGVDGFILIAGGIGIAPIMSMLRTLDGEKDQRHIVLFYGNRDAESIGFKSELDDLSTRLNLEVIHVLEKTDDPKIEKGYITEAVIKRHLPQDISNYDFFLCGPGMMVKLVDGALKDLKIPAEQIWDENYDMA